MKIGLRAGHSPNCTGAIGIVREHDEMKKFYKYVRDILNQYGHTIIDCNSNASSQSSELNEGVIRANNNNVDLFISLHMNSFNGQAHGVESLVSSENSKAHIFARNLCLNFNELGFANRGVKYKKLFEMNYSKAPNIIFEMCFCDNQTDIDIYNRYSWSQLAYAFCNAIDSNIPKSPEDKKAYIVTKYLPFAYEGYKGVDINYILQYFNGIKTYVRGDNTGIWIETAYMPLAKCQELKNTLGSWFYEIKE